MKTRQPQQSVPSRAAAREGMGQEGSRGVALGNEEIQRRMREASVTPDGVRTTQDQTVAPSSTARSSAATTGVGGMDIPTKHVFQEQMAHDFAYEYIPEVRNAKGEVTSGGGLRAKGKPGEPGYRPAMSRDEFTALLRTNGYQRPSCHDDEESDFRMMGFAPIEGSGNAPVLSFRGTDSAEGWYDDMNRSGVGTKQFGRNYGAIESELARLSEGGQKVDLTGHSLGGALAQRTATQFGHAVSGVTTFQSAGIPEHYTRDWREKHGGGAPPDQQHDVTHYVAEGDIVHRVGSALDGKVIEADTDNTVGWGPGRTNLVEADLPVIPHTHTLLQGDASLRTLDHHPNLDAASAGLERGRKGIGDLWYGHEFYGEDNPGYEALMSLMSRGLAGDPTMDFDGYLGNRGKEVWEEQSKAELIDRATNVELQQSRRDTPDSASASSLSNTTRDGAVAIEQDKGLLNRARNRMLRRTADAAFDPNEIKNVESGRIHQEANTDAAIDARQRQAARRQAEKPNIKGARSAGDNALGQQIKASNKGRGSVEIIHDSPRRK